MTIRKEEAVYYLSYKLGKVDGEYSEDEQKEIIANSDYYRKILHNINNELLLEGLNNGMLNVHSACYVLEKLSELEKIEILASFLFIVMADGEMSDEESELYSQYLTLMDVESGLVISKWKEMR